MAEQKEFIVKESIRYGGQSYLPGALIVLSAVVAAELAAFIQDAPDLPAKSGVSEHSDQSELVGLRAQLQQYKDQLALEATAKGEAREQLTQKEKDLSDLHTANTKTAGELATAKEKLANLGKELGELKKAAKKEGGK